MSECNHDCSHCSSNCEQREMKKEDFLIKTNAESNIKKVVAVVSGKGGVGKSLITSLLAVAARRAGMQSAIMDADVTGPSIPQAFNLSEQLGATGKSIIPAVTTTGIKVVSTNLILDDFTTPVVWRGPVIAGVVKQFYSETDWGDVDCLFVDMPPGTGDVPITVFQSLPVDGIVVVSTPQQLVGGIVEKAIRMAGMMDIPVLGIIENMSYVQCEECGNKIPLFGKGNIDEIAERYDIPVLAKLPLNPSVTEAIDGGNAEYIDMGDLLDNAVAAVINC